MFPFRYYERLAAETMITLGQQFLMVDLAFADVGSTRPSLAAPACFFPVSVAVYGLCLQTPKWMVYDNQANSPPYKELLILFIWSTSVEKGRSAVAAGVVSLAPWESPGSAAQHSPGSLALPASVPDLARGQGKFYFHFFFQGEKKIIL